MPLFFKNYENLKRTEQWQKIIVLGLESLKNTKIGDKDKALIQTRLASSYYYLGKYVNAYHMAFAALENAKKAKNDDLSAKSLYLISATYRARALAAKTSKDHYDEYKRFADNIQKALNLALTSKVNDFIKAKVFFNAGALHHDLIYFLEENERNAQFETAAEYYQESRKLFQPSSDDFNRVVIRYIRLMMDNQKIETFAKLIDLTKEIGININKKTKTGVQFLHLLSKISLHFKEYENARQYASEALVTAEAKSMHTEINMLNQLINDSNIEENQECSKLKFH